MIDNFSKFGWTVLSQNENAQAMKVSLGNNPLNSKKSPNLIETDRGKEFVNKISIEFSNKNNIKDILEILPWEQYLLKCSTVLSEIFLKDLFLKMW